MPVRLLTLLLLPLGLFVSPDEPCAAALYKSLQPNGTILFSDVPAPGARILEERRLGERRSDGMALVETPYGYMPYVSVEFETALAQANERVDLAERALAQARRNVWSPREGLRLAGPSRTRADDERIEFYRKNLKEARKALVDLLRERQLIASR